MAVVWRRHVKDDFALGPHRINMHSNIGLRIAVNDGADIGGIRPRIADRQFLHRTDQHFGEFFGNVGLHIQTPQRRTPLARGLERAFNNGGHCLFRQRCAVHDHRIQTACFRDQWRAHRAMHRHG